MKPAIRYRVVVQEDLVHEYTRQEIEEIWIPGINTCVNEKYGCFSFPEPRAKGDDIEISLSQYELVEEFIEAQQGLLTVVGALF